MSTKNQSLQNDSAISNALTSHHAFLIEGEWSSLFHHLEMLLGTHLGVSFHGNSNLEIFKTVSFTIDDARMIKDKALQSALGENTLRVFIIVAETITLQAQNALLKLAEEPTARVKIFIITPFASRLLPTLQSRLYSFSIETETDKETIEYKKSKEYFISEQAYEFCRKKYSSQRLEIVKDLLKKIDDGEMTKTDIAHFLEAIHKQALIAKKHQFLKKLHIAHTYLFDQSSSIKLLLEFLALSW